MPFNSRREGEKTSVIDVAGNICRDIHHVVCGSVGAAAELASELLTRENKLC